MWHMAPGGGWLPRAAVAAALTLLGLLAFSVPALGGDQPPVPKPDPPPRAKPPPPPPPAPQPVAPQPVASAAVPKVVHPTVAERRAAAKRRAKRKAAHAARARARIAAAKKPAATPRREQASDGLLAGNDGASSNWRMAFLLALFSPALLLLGLALMPARVVPWSRASRALEARRDELGVLGAMGLVATLAFFLLVAAMK